MKIVALSFASLRQALAEGWAMANATRGVSIAYAAIFTLAGLVIVGSLLAQGLTPFVVAAAGAFMLVGPAILAGFFGIARSHEVGEAPRFASVISGFEMAAPAVWALALVCALLFMIFVIDAAILYSYMVGVTPVWLTDIVPASASVMKFLLWGAVSGLVVAFLLFCVSAFSVPLLCERRAGLVNAVTASVRIVFGNFLPAMLWAALMSTLIIGSILPLPLLPLPLLPLPLLPLPLLPLPLTLPWLAYASRALYRQALPPG